MRSLRYLLLQMRNTTDAMRLQEVGCFVRALGCDESQIDVFDFLTGAPSSDRVGRADIVLLGGSGHYSVAESPPSHAGGGLGLAEMQKRLAHAFDALRELHRLAKPTFASCWGFQAMARALGGRCIHDPQNAELGTIELQLSPAGKRDPLFGQLPTRFPAQAGHEDHVIELPPGAVLLASSEKVPEHAYTFPDRLIYCTQFHPELDCQGVFKRVQAYPGYLARVLGVTVEEFATQCQETPAANGLLRRFVELVIRQG